MSIQHNASTAGTSQDGNVGPLIIIVVDQEGALLPAGESGIRLGLAELHWLAVRLGAEGDEADVPAADTGSVRQIEEELVRRGLSAPAPHPGTDTRDLVSPAAPVPAGALRLPTPVAVALTPAGFTFVDHNGAARARLSARELAGTLGFIAPVDVDQAHGDQIDRLGTSALGREQFEHLAGRLVAAGVVVPVGGGAGRQTEARVRREYRRGLALVRSRREQVEKVLARQREEEAQREAATGRARTRVVPVNSEGEPLLSLGLLMAHAAAVDGGRLTESYRFVPDWCDRTVPALTGDEPPGIYLFSNYIWSHAWNVTRSAEVKAKSPHSLTVHGGPNTPKYPADTERFFAMNPHVDVAVHGEGEATFAHMLEALEGQLGEGPPDLSVLRDVPGLTFRAGGELVSTGKRDRIAELDSVASPYITGLFDSIGDVEITIMTFETNRGCPYGCTFCDWGSATLSRMRKFDLDRIFRELEWCAKHKVRTVFCADSNFGIFSRDVEIAQKVVELKRQYGYPVIFESSYAKNTVKHLRDIIQTLVAGGVLSTGTLSLQSVDTETLDAIHRSNIKVEKYNDLAVEFGKQSLPLVVELMMGLPGSTLQSFVDDLQQVIDREVKARVNQTEVLMNSPMNAPDYREEHQIETLRPIHHDWTTRNGIRKKALVVSTSTFSRDDYERMERYRRVFLLCENFGVLRQVSRFVRQEAGLREMDFYARLADTVSSGRSRWPTIAFTFGTMLEYMIPPVSWRLFLDEVRDYLVTQIGIGEDRALDCVIAVQHALLPAPDRDFPYQTGLAHDYAAWYEAMIGAKRSANATDWTSVVPRLETFGPGVFEVDDPQSIGEFGFGMSLFYDADSDWELQSPVVRHMRYRHHVYD